MTRMHKLRARLGGSASLLEPFPLGPRYMITLRARYMWLSRQNTADLQGFVSRLKRRIGVKGVIEEETKKRGPDQAFDFDRK